MTNKALNMKPGTKPENKVVDDWAVKVEARLGELYIVNEQLEKLLEPFKEDIEHTFNVDFQAMSISQRVKIAKLLLRVHNETY